MIKSSKKLKKNILKKSRVIVQGTDIDEAEQKLGHLD